VSVGRPHPAPRRPLRGHHVFLSASIPDRKRWTGDFDPLEITDAVVMSASAIWTAGGKILSGGHPAITPLLLRVARNFHRTAEENQATPGDPLVTVYQSLLYQHLVPEETKRLETAGLGRLKFIEAQPGDDPQHGRNTASLELMRDAMLAPENDPVLAIFIGGMEGIRDEYDKYGRSYEKRPVYPIGAPGGEARTLAKELLDAEPDRRILRTELLNSAEYGALMDDILADAAAGMDT